MDMIKLACTDISLNSHYGVSIVLFTFGLDSALILLSYVLIFQSVLAIASPRDRLNTLNTGVSHVLAVLIFYVPMVSVSIVHRFGVGLPHAVHTLMSLIYLFVPPMLNPIISFIRTKEIQRRLFKMLFRVRSWLFGFSRSPEGFYIGGRIIWTPKEERVTLEDASSALHTLW